MQFLYLSWHPGHVCGPPQEVVQDTGSLHTGIHVGRADLNDSSLHTPLRCENTKGILNNQPCPLQPVIENSLPAG